MDVGVENTSKSAQTTHLLPPLLLYTRDPYQDHCQLQKDEDDL